MDICGPSNRNSIRLALVLRGEHSVRVIETLIISNIMSSSEKPELSVSGSLNFALISFSLILWAFRKEGCLGKNSCTVGLL